MAQKKLPLAGVRVVEFGQYIAAPGAAMLLADLGAEVVKVEGLGGDSARMPDAQGHTPMFLAYNRHKRSNRLHEGSSSGARSPSRLMSLSSTISTLSGALASGAVAGPGASSVCGAS